MIQRALICAAGMTLLATSGCAAPASYVARNGVMQLPPITVYQDQQGPLSYHSTVATPHLVTAARVQGEACQRGVTLPIVLPLSFGWEQGGYEQALKDASKRSGGRMLADVQADIRTFSVLGIFTQRCVVVNAAVVGDAPAPVSSRPTAGL